MKTFEVATFGGVFREKINHDSKITNKSLYLSYLIKYILVGIQGGIEFVSIHSTYWCTHMGEYF